MPGVKRRLSFSDNPAPMAKRSRKNKSRVRRSRKAKKSGRKSVNLYASTNGPVPQRTYVKMRYTETFNVYPSVSGTIGSYVFRANSIYAPNYTGGGHQPYGHDTYQTLYSRYKVHKVVFRVTIRPSSVGSSTAFLATDNGGGSYDVQSMTVVGERPHVYVKPINMYVPTVMKRTILPRSVCGATKGEYNDDKYSAAFGASPSEAIHVVFGHLTNNGQNSMVYDVDATYFVECFDPKILGPS